ncbi:CRISPR-associated endonuclease Cas2 [Aquaspirillum sp. LM1]|uniref:CRISPR-associated endonuclease Cas2 n=1 Tax=Aquaspirillum sp. LM1 TaxID=1938604 RepID=UPI000983D2C1|nr:CRISPR-associated endonuclease Cas2 [Aquaspirillum sp. LM1]AQR64904.1 CRISPR-associated endonuclease Cas2 [Aquaspirillum sp. LM1]
MTSSRLVFPLCDDIADPKRWRKVHEAVQAHAVSGQKSVYECWLTAGEHQALLARLEAVIAPAEDKVHVFALDARRKVLRFGVARAPQCDPFLIV